MKEKVVLAYSGGLDTTALIPWLKETFDYEVICCCVNCGQGNELDGLDERAKLSGASKLYIEDIVDDFCDNYVMPCVQAGAVYEHKYLLGTSMARPAIAKKLVEIARKENAVAICHGATGKGNDQIRFELGIKALAPDIKIIAPWRMTDVWTMQSREDEIAFCQAHGINLPFDASHSYSRDRNLWHISHEGLELEDPSQAPNYDDMLVLSVTPEKAPDKETEITMTFEAGVPKTLNGKAMKVSEIITELNRLGGENGIGIIDIVENRVCWYEIPWCIRNSWRNDPDGCSRNSSKNCALTVIPWKPRRNSAASLLRSYTKENGSHHFCDAIQSIRKIHSGICYR